MKNTQKGLGAIAIVIILALMAVLGGAAVYKMRNNSSVSVSTPTSQSTVPAATETPVVATAKDSSDAVIDQDSAAVNAKLSALDKDSANIDAGINDQQGNLSEQ